MELSELITKIINIPECHAKWLNTLSMMENVGARKIARFEDPELTTTAILKHASEEARHAYILKRMIPKTGVSGYDTYESQYLFVPGMSKHYLNKLDVFAARYLKNNFNLKGYPMRCLAYLLVTYAIEMRADSLYPIYEAALKATRTKYISVRSIIIEEEGHLEEMISQLEEGMNKWETHAKAITEFESKLFKKWVEGVKTEVLESVDNKSLV